MKVSHNCCAVALGIVLAVKELMYIINESKSQRIASTGL